MMVRKIKLMIIPVLVLLSFFIVDGVEASRYVTGGVDIVDDLGKMLI